MSPLTVSDRPMLDVLVVDDEDATRSGLKELLVREGMTVDDAGNGATALQKLETHDFGVILLDVQMPGIGGLDVLARCSEKQTPSKIIVMTGFDTPETVVAALRAHAYDFISKPIATQRLVETVRDALAVGKNPVPIEVLSARPDWVELLVPCTREAADRIQRFVQRLETDLPDAVRDSVGLAFRELLLNGVEWGGQLNPAQKVRVACIRTPRLLIYRIADPGQGFSFDDLPHAQAPDASDATAHVLVRQERGLRPGGFGIVLIRSIADELIYNERQNEVLFVKYLEKE